MKQPVRKGPRVFHIICWAVILLCLAGIAVRLCGFALHRGQEEQLRQQLQADMTDITEKSQPNIISEHSAMADADMQVPAVTDEAVQVPAVTDEDAQVPSVSSSVSGRELLAEYASLADQNPDLAGWLKIPDTEIDGPVLQSLDNSFYETHDFYGRESKYGALFVKDAADVDKPDTNIIIYGHNMKDGSMFGGLALYKKEAYFREHPVIYFDTLYEKREFEILSVFLSQVYDQEEDVFKYYQFTNAETEEEFQDFYENIRKLSLYDTGVEASFGDTFLTLSTCSYHVADGRLVVVARRTGNSSKVRRS